ncbi:MAG: hypothetical protein WC807_06325 [Hyphomicrobium sp.]|jgi:TRAP-type mannitol/chloroaromatic compound transport system substrate-binding protein
MDRREFLVTSGGAAAAAATASAAAAQERPLGPMAEPTAGSRTLRLSMPWADNGQGFGDSARRLANRISVLSGGRFHVVVTGGYASDRLEETSDLVHGSAQDLATHHPAFAYFAGLPGATGLAAADHATWLLAGGGQMLWDDLAKDSGVKPLLAGHTGPNAPLWSARPIASLNDLEGQNIFAPGLGADVARGLGANPVTVPATNIATALLTGQLAAVEWGGLLASMALGLQRSAPFALQSGIHTHGTALALNVRLAVWEKLSTTDQAILSAAALEEFHTSVAEARAHENIVRTALAQAFGIEFSAVPADIAEALKRVSEATIAHVSGYDARAGRIDQSYMAFRSAITDAALSVA